jgi:peptidoglycan/LPS O-acetylase OafA/YrhL
MPSESSRLPLIDLLKAVAAQLIVWHHFAFYDPLSDIAYPCAPALFDWLYNHARIAVQVFLVTGGFLAARTLRARFAGTLHGYLDLLWRRYLRLARPYWIAVACAALLAVDAPTVRQLLAHAVFLQDILHQEALSAGVWYIAIDFQLFALLAFFFLLSPRFHLVLCALLAAASLFWFNRDPDLDIWAVYFFGSYAFGVLAECIARQTRRAPWVLALTALIAASLVVEYRPRILVAGLTALALASLGDNAPAWLAPRPVRFLARISYGVFLIHYPVYLCVGMLVARLAPASVEANVVGLFAAWALSLAAGTLLEKAGAIRPSPARAN